MTPCWFCLSAIFSGACWRILSYVFLSLNSTSKWPIKVFRQTSFWEKGDLLNSLFLSLDWATFYLNTECWWKKLLFFFFFHHLSILRTQVHPDTWSGKASCTSFLYSFFLFKLSQADDAGSVLVAQGGSLSSNVCLALCIHHCIPSGQCTAGHRI